MSQEINLGGTIYISSRRGAEITGYSQDYIGQLARSAAIEARRVSGLWYVLESSLIAHKERAEQFVPTPPQKSREIEDNAPVSFEGKEYISASRASEISGYSQDYVTQLAREGKIFAEQSANRWYVERDSLLEHKKEKDSLLAAVQSEAVGIRDTGEIELKLARTGNNTSSHFTYIEEYASDLLPIKERKGIFRDESAGDAIGTLESETCIPIRIVDDGKYQKITPEMHQKPSRGGFKVPVGLITGAILIIGTFSLLYNFKSQVLKLNMHVPEPVFIENFISKELIFLRQTDF